MPLLFSPGMIGLGWNKRDDEGRPGFAMINDNPYIGHMPEVPGILKKWTQFIR